MRQEWDSIICCNYKPQGQVLSKKAKSFEILAEKRQFWKLWLILTAHYCISSWQPKNFIVETLRNFFGKTKAKFKLLDRPSILQSFKNILESPQIVKKKVQCKSFCVGKSDIIAQLLTRFHERISKKFRLHVLPSSSKPSSRASSRASTASPTLGNTNFVYIADRKSDLS